MWIYEALLQFLKPPIGPCWLGHGRVQFKLMGLMQKLFSLSLQTVQLLKNRCCLIREFSGQLEQVSRDGHLIGVWKDWKLLVLYFLRKSLASCPNQAAFTGSLNKITPAAPRVWACLILNRLTSALLQSERISKFQRFL